MGFIFLVLGFWCVSFLTDWLALERIQLIFKYFLLMVLLVATVSFQPELRRGLMKLGGARFSRNTVPQIANVIEQIIDSVAILSRSEIGGIIAIEREVGLADYIASGTQIDSEVTADLLNTIFWPGSPLHDMGVVIRKGKLAAAGVQFPLAEYGDFDRMLGSRHRAAIGLSKATDAAIVVVSEETGNISLAQNGKLARFLTLEQLRQQLLDLMLPLATEPQKTKKRKTSDESNHSSQVNINTPSSRDHEDLKNSPQSTHTNLSGQEVADHVQ